MPATLHIILHHRVALRWSPRGVPLLGVLHAALIVSLAGCWAKQPAPQTSQPQRSDSKGDPLSSANPDKKSPAKSTLGNTVHRQPDEIAAPAEPPSNESTTSEFDANGATESPGLVSDVAIPSNQSSPRGDGHKKSKRKSIPDIEATTKRVHDLAAKARQAKNRKDYGNAFHLTTQAWEATRLHPGDARLQSLGNDLFAELGKLGDLANAKSSASVKDTTKTLIDN